MLPKNLVQFECPTMCALMLWCLLLKFDFPLLEVWDSRAALSYCLSVSACAVRCHHKTAIISGGWVCGERGNERWGNGWGTFAVELLPPSPAAVINLFFLFFPCRCWMLYGNALFTCFFSNSSWQVNHSMNRVDGFICLPSVYAMFTRWMDITLKTNHGGKQG